MSDKDDKKEEPKAPPVQDASTMFDFEDPPGDEPKKSSAPLGLEADPEPPPPELHVQPTAEDVYDNVHDIENLKKKAARRKVFFISGSIVFALFFILYVFFSGDEPKKPKVTSEDQIAENFKKGKIHDASDLESRTNRLKPKELKPSPEPPKQPPNPSDQAANTTNENKQASATDSTSPGPKKGGGGGGSNFNKDAKIVERYEQINPEAAAAAIVPGASYSYQNNRLSRKTFEAGSAEADEKRSASSNTASKNILDFHFKNVKVKLLYAYRSSSSGQVVAISTEPSGMVPAGSYFTGSEACNNRVYVSFSEVSFDGKTYVINGTALQGQEPGLFAEVTDLSSSNAAANVVIGATKVGVNALAKVGGSYIGTAPQDLTASGVDDVQKQAQAQKQNLEYRVAAGTGFNVFIK